MDIRKLEQGRAALQAEAKGIIESAVSAGRPVTAEEAKRGEEIVAEISRYDSTIAMAKAARDAAPAIETVEHVSVGAPNATKAPWAEGYRGLGEWGKAIRAAVQGIGFDERLLNGMSRQDYMAAATGMNEQFGGDGGFAVPIEQSTLIEKEMYTVGDILSRVDARTISGNAIAYTSLLETSRVDGSRQGGVLGYWVDEGTAPDPTKFQLQKFEMKLRKVACLGYTTEELEQDAAALGQELANAFGTELLFQVESKIFAGTGAGAPLGLMKAPCLVTVAKEVGQAADTIISKNLSKMWMRLPVRSKSNAVWCVNADCMAQLDELSIPAGTAALEPRFVTYGPDGIMRIKGRPVIEVEYCETLGDLGDIVLADFSKYRLIRKGAGVQQASSIHVRFTQGENAYRATYRVDGQPVPRAAITPYKGSSTVSPFVTLAERA